MTQYYLALEFMLGNSGTKLPDAMERSVRRGCALAAKAAPVVPTHIISDFLPFGVG